jgi:hypothetical protein
MIRIVIFAVSLVSLVPAFGADLAAAGGCVNGRVVIQNKSGDVWTDIKIEVNRVYVHVADAIPPHETNRFLPQIFTKSDGTRLDLSRVACKTIDIHATTPAGRRHWNGAYKQ